ncbi:MAG: CapA family protein, partial [Eggerthellaceae bacterium]|nr:CapA family protein [Eggerthellaceae bacterium]
MKRAALHITVIALLVSGLALASCAPADPWSITRERIADEAARHFSISLGFAGDICFADNYIPMEHLAEIGSTDIADGIDQRFIDIMRGQDLMWINNEFCYSDRGEPLEGKMYTFRGSPSHVTYLDDLGVDIAGLANNHVFDYGEEAFIDTLATLENDNMPYVGAGRNIEAAKAPVYLETGGFTIGYVAASCAEYTIYTPEATDSSPGIL